MLLPCCSNCFFLIFELITILEAKYGIFDQFKNRYSWLKSYAVFQAFKSANNNEPWWLWNAEFKKSINLDDLDSAILMMKLTFIFFLQYLFFGQWLKLKSYANERDFHFR